MAPRKITPVSQQQLKSLKGITFSFDLSPVRTTIIKSDAYLPPIEPISPPPSPSSTTTCVAPHPSTYNLKPNVHRITVESLLNRLDTFDEATEVGSDRSPVLPKCEILIPLKRESGVGRKRKLSYSPSANHCGWCQSNKTAQWRKGPSGPRTLCNACGLEWAKQIRQASTRYSVSLKEAEHRLVSNPELIRIIMAPRKQKPLAQDIVKNTRGITFSFQLQQEQTPASSPTVTPVSSPKEETEYNLSVNVHTITSTSLLNRLQSEPESRPRKRKITQSTSQPGECQWCFTKKTAQWRKGPTGARGLCNRCGIEWAKQIKQEAKQFGISNTEAEQRLVGTYRTSERFIKFSKEHLENNDNLE
ncbi:blue light receptor [Boothiomyces sp. JEL0866]|nr:blue light receptor [Boothiomyces sp. JEL0866]